MLLEDRKTLIACIAGSIVSYNAIRLLRAYYAAAHCDEWIPVGTIKHLWVHPIKSCKRKEVFSLFCDELGPRHGENRDREFIAIDGETGAMYSARNAPRLQLIEADVADGVLTVSTPDGVSARVVLSDVADRAVVRRATIFGDHCDGLDCGDDVARVFSEFLEISDVRLIYYRDDLFNGRPCVTEPGWWKNPVPKRSDTVRYVDLSPYHITTEESMRAVNKELDEPVESKWFRANIVVEHSLAWDEDRWAEMKMGDVVLQCYKPCTRCILTTVNPDNGVKSPEMQPLKRMRDLRLAPEGPLRDVHGQFPIFGVNAGLLTPGYVHVGQTVYVKYKPSAF
ncbi:hypothetical protein PRIPAC_81659 [Pristionchus pacificus]|uniref:MOSC domain-containing protein n=1 Tax=Pristionchus pacificus TaxID=54126 RepID=A0A2A6CKS8_PRIPA|nr:hypothetical protein PRIPAC_81659 [Pristionchus pacificus]|eukprot:PDM78710.1 hypothetical protein PRIPAC_31289 [Pristionchus pacificus]